MKKNNNFLSLAIILAVILSLFSACTTTQMTNEPIDQNVPMIEQQQSVSSSIPATINKESDIKKETNTEKVTSTSNTESVMKKDSNTSNYSVPTTSKTSTETQQTRLDNYSDANQISDTQDNTDKKEITVYITRTGAKYHQAGCRYLSRSCIPISLSDAQASGYDACSVCDPPE